MKCHVTRISHDFLRRNEDGDKEGKRREGRGGNEYIFMREWGWKEEVRRRERGGKEARRQVGYYCRCLASNIHYKAYDKQSLITPSAVLPLLELGPKARTFEALGNIQDSHLQPMQADVANEQRYKDVTN